MAMTEVVTASTLAADFALLTTTRDEELVPRSNLAVAMTTLALHTVQWRPDKVDRVDKV